MVIEDIAYIIHVKALAEHVSTSVSSQQQLLFVDLEQSPPKMSCVEEKDIASEFAKIQKLFSSVFPFEASEDLPSFVRPLMATQNKEPSKCKVVDVSRISELDRASEAIDHLDFLQDAQITLPSLNGQFLPPNYYNFTGL